MSDLPNSENTKPQTSKLAKLSVRIILLSILCFPFGIVVPNPLGGIWFRFFFMAWIVGVCCGLVSVVEISLSKGRLKGALRVFAAIVLPPILFFLTITNYMTRARPDPGAWYEARTTAGTIATALRAYAVEKGKYGDYPPNLTDLGFTKDDIDGKLFSFDDYSLDASYDPNLDPPIRFTVIVTAPREIEKSTSASLDHQGNWKQYP